MNIIDVIEKYARHSPKSPAFVEIRALSRVRRETSWREFADRIDSLARALVAMGAKKGENVFILGKNSLGWLEAYFATLKTGARATPLNFRFTDDEILFCARTAEPVIFIFDEDYQDRLDQLRADLPSVRSYLVVDGQGVRVDDTIENSASLPPSVELQDDTDAALYFTSGTTGVPKPVLIHHKGLMCTAFTEAANHGLVQSDRFLMMPPVYHTAIGHMLGIMLVGACNVLLTEQIRPEVIIETIEKERISVVFLLVPWAIDLIEALDKRRIRIEQHDLASWRLTHMGAQPIPPGLVRQLKAYFPNMLYDTNYGLSESMGPGAVHLGMENERKVGAIGKPGLMWDARIVNDAGHDVPQGDVGELILKGPSIMKGYYKNPELTALTIVDGWLRTGDLGKFDEEGFIYLVDRKKDLVISGGENIYPVEVEGVILKHQKVRDCAVIGIPHNRLVEVACAVIETVSGETLTEQEMRAYCEQHLPRYKRPHRIIFDRVPRNPTGKIEKPKLREKYAKGN
jgi:long-chain acyl-CoA synthetase